MRPKNSLVNSRIDRITVVIYFFLVIGGLAMIHSVERPPDGFELDYAAMLTDTFVGKQFMWLMISLVGWSIINLLINRDTWVVGAYPIYGLTIILLILVLVVGKEINNARSWFSVAGFTFQPSEIAKFGTCLAMAAFLSQWRERLNAVGPILSGMAIWMIPSVLIIMQPDPGSALVFVSFLLVMYREGLPPLLLLFVGFTALMFILGILQPLGLLAGGMLVILMIIMSFSAPRRKQWWLLMSLLTAVVAATLYYLGVGWPVLAGLGILYVGTAAYHFLRKNTALVGITLATLLWGSLLAGLADFTFKNVLKPHHQDRIDAWLRPERLDEQGPLYNIIQAKLAIAAGGLTGKGRNEGTMTRYDYVPEQETDFIFTAVGEQEGWVGVVLLLLGFTALLWRISILAERQRRPFTRAYAYGVAGIILIHLLINVGMVLGIMPVIGIPLPFLSKGGSSLLSFTLMIAVLLKLDRHREAV